MVVTDGMGQNIQKDLIHKNSYLSIDLVGLLPSAAEQVPSFVLNVANVDVIAVVFTKWNPGATEHKEVVPM